MLKKTLIAACLALAAVATPAAAADTELPEGISAAIAESGKPICSGPVSTSSYQTIAVEIRQAGTDRLTSFDLSAEDGCRTSVRMLNRHSYLASITISPAETGVKTDMNMDTADEGQYLYVLPQGDQLTVAYADVDVTLKDFEAGNGAVIQMPNYTAHVFKALLTANGEPVPISVGEQDFTVTVAATRRTFGS